MDKKCEHNFFLEDKRREIISNNSNDQCTDMKWNDIKTYRCSKCLCGEEVVESGKLYNLYRNNR